MVVFAAASLSGVLPVIGEAFESSFPGIRVKFNFDGSQRLRTQLEYGAKADVFASADEIQMDRALRAGALNGPPVPFATNSLVVIVPASHEDRDPSVDAVADLAMDGVKLAIAHQDVPAGQYARAVFSNLQEQDSSLGADFAHLALTNVVSEEANVRAVVQKVVLDEVDAGIVYSTDASHEEVSNAVRVVPIPMVANVEAVYPVASVKGTRHPQAAAKFIEFLLSEQGRKTFRKHGFGVPGAMSRTPAVGPKG